MFRKINIRVVFIVFAVLLAIALLTEIIDSRKGGRTFKDILLEFKPDEITRIEIMPKAAGQPSVVLEKESEGWVVAENGKKFNADGDAVKSVLSELNGLKTESVAATSKNNWKQFEVTDSLATRVRLYEGKKQAGGIYIGKFSFSQPRKMTSFVRLDGETEVYGVDGMLAMAFSRGPDSFRDRTVIKSKSSDWKRLTFTYPADSSFTLEKSGNSWLIGGQAADSSAVARYFSSIGSLSENKFAGKNSDSASTHKLKIEGDNMAEAIEITGYPSEEGKLLVESSQNKGACFNNPELAKKIFPSKSEFQK